MVLPRPVHAVVFDMDGLLCDTETIFRDAMMSSARAFGREMPLEVFLTMVGTSDQRSQDIEIAHFGPDFPIADYRAQLYATARAAFARGVTLKPGVVELLDHLDALALPRAICTSSSPAAVQSHLGASGLVPRFDAIIARGDYSAGKPHPEPYLTAARKLGVAPENCLALENSAQRHPLRARRRHDDDHGAGSAGSDGGHTPALRACGGDAARRACAVDG